jgi:hypothetical protein
MSDTRLTEAQLQLLYKKIEREWPVRCKLAELAGHKANPKNVRALFETEFDLTIRELYLEVLFRKPENAEAALALIQEFYK